MSFAAWHLDESLGSIIGSGRHWTAIIKKGGVIVHLDSIPKRGGRVAQVVINARWLSSKAVFKVTEGNVQDVHGHL